MTRHLWQGFFAVAAVVAAGGCGGTVDGGESGGAGQAGGGANTFPREERCDEACDGTIDVCYSYEYDKLGNLQTRKVDLDCNGSLSECNTWTYDDQGRILSVTNDRCDGKPYACWTMEWITDSASTWKSDAECDGSVEICTDETYNSDGNLIYAAKDRECDGEDDFCITFTYDQAGNILTSQGDFDCTGTHDDCFEYDYDYDALGRVESYSEAECGASPMQCCTYGY